MAEKTARVIVTGKVQRVFFRDFAKQNANKLGLTGYAKNLKDGSLELVLRGDESKIMRLVTLCKSGPIFAKVTAVNTEFLDDGDVDEFEFFDIRPT
ncbi:MAG: acylphosphatase [Candidatus Woesearchaeota archaeon]